MPTIIYLHGFLSSPLSNKAQQTKAWVEENYPDITFCCPQLFSQPEKTVAFLNGFVESLAVKQASEKPEAIYLIGSSLGGFWATYLVESELANKAVLINPAVAPHLRLREYIGQSLKHYYSDEIYRPSKHDMAVLESLEIPVLRHAAYWLMVQEQDEVLDYRLAQNKYKASRQWVEPGGDHSFAGYTDHLPAIMQFFLADTE